MVVILSGPQSGNSLRPLGTNINGTLIEIHTFFIHEKAFEKCRSRNGGHLFRPQYV